MVKIVFFCVDCPFSELRAHLRCLKGHELEYLTLPNEMCLQTTPCGNPKSLFVF